MRRRLRAQFADKQRQSNARRDISGRETRRYGSAGGGGGGSAIPLFAVPIRLQGTTPAAGDASTIPRSNHQHGIETTLTGKTAGTLAHYSNRGYMKAGSSNICITHIE